MTASQETRRVDRPAPPRRRAAVVIAVMAAAAAVLTACTPVVDDDVRADLLADYHAQSLDWGACDDFAVTALDDQYFPLAPDDAECARLSVPLDYQQAADDDTSASVAVVRIPARG